MVDHENIINFPFLDINPNSDSFNILIVINCPIILDIYISLKKSCDFVICADGAANRLYELDDKNKPELVPNIIVGDFDSIKKEVKEYYEKSQVHMIEKQDQESCDLEKCLYIAIEKLGELEDSFYFNSSKRIKKNSIIIYASNGGRIDNTLSTFHCVFKYRNNFYDQLFNSEIYMVSKRNICVFLKGGLNTIFHHKANTNSQMNYSIIALNGEGLVKVTENNEEKSSLITFGEKLFLNQKITHNIVKVYVDNEDMALLYICNSPFYDKLSKDTNSTLN